MSRSHGSPIALVLALTVAWLQPAPAQAVLVVVQNDSVIDFGSVAIQAGFVAGERGAAWLTPPCDGDLVAVRVLWLDLFNSGTQTLGEAISISDAGAFPVPGSLLLELKGPVMTEGFFNEFALPSQIPVFEDLPFVVDFRFFSNPPALGPSLVSDIDGCQGVSNGIFAIPPSAWFDACALGLSGDLAIRAVVSCPVEIFNDGFESGDTSAWSTTEPFGASAPKARHPVLRVDIEPPARWRYPDVD
jgi:hypothetical protein